MHWRGVALVVAGLVATLVLAMNGGLVLYIHPRYIVFTVVMTLIALALVAASLFARPSHDHDPEPARGLPRLLSVFAIVAAGVIAIAMVGLPAATLTSATAVQRDPSGLSIGKEAQNVDSVSSARSAVFKKFTVVDWASLLRQTSDLSFYDSKPVDVTGFITADPDDPENVFYVSRFVITCCAVDAQPAGVPVYLENWGSSLKADQWVRVTGGFAANPSESSKRPIALHVSTIKPVERPSAPYLY